MKHFSHHSRYFLKFLCVYGFLLLGIVTLSSEIYLNDLTTNFDFFIFAGFVSQSFFHLYFVALLFTVVLIPLRVIAKMSSIRVLGTLLFSLPLIFWITNTVLYSYVGIHLLKPTTIEYLRNDDLRGIASINMSHYVLFAIVCSVSLFLSYATQLLSKYLPLPQKLLKRILLALALSGIFGLVLFKNSDDFLRSSRGMPFADLYLNINNQLPNFYLTTSMEDHFETPIKRRSHILLFVIETFRKDNLSEELMPNFHEFFRKEKCVTLDKHFTNSHISHYSLFSMLYGINTGHYLAYAQPRVTSPILDFLKESQYHREAFLSSTFKSYHFGKLWNLNFDSYMDRQDLSMPSWKTDILLSKHVNQLESNSGKPLFFMGYYHATHPDYSYPDDFKIYPTTKDLKNRMSMIVDNSSEENKRLIYNHYKNATRYVDSMFASIETKLSEFLANDSIILFVGDHGEAFWEQGKYGHSQPLFYKDVVQPFISICASDKDFLKNIDPEKITSHQDLLPTAMHYIGADISSLQQTKIDGHSIFPESPSSGPQKKALLSVANGFPIFEKSFVIITKKYKYYAQLVQSKPIKIHITKIVDHEDNTVDTPLVLPQEILSEVQETLGRNVHLP